MRNHSQGGGGMIFNPNVMAAAGGSGGAVIGTYTGNGKKTRTIEFNIEPAIVFIHSTDSSAYGNMYIYIANSNGYGVQLSNNTSTHSSQGTINGKTLTITDYSPNTNGETYTYIAIPKA